MTTSPEPLADHEVASDLVRELYEAHSRMVVGLCRFLLRDSVEAEDAAQQSFFAAHRSLLGGAVPRDPPAWLATIARNECRARIKQRMREPLALHDADAAAGDLSDPFHKAVENADLTALREGLADLPPSQRKAFMLREFAGLSYGELATALGVSGAAVESLLVRARAKLRLALAHVNPFFVPLVVRDQLSRVMTGVDDGSTGMLAKIASVPLAAKLAAAGAGVALVAVGGNGLKGHRPSDRLAAPAPVAAASRDRPRGVVGAGAETRESVLSLPAVGDRRDDGVSGADAGASGGGSPSNGQPFGDRSTAGAGGSFGDLPEARDGSSPLTVSSRSGMSPDERSAADGSAGTDPGVTSGDVSGDDGSGDGSSDGGTPSGPVPSSPGSNSPGSSGPSVPSSSSPSSTSSSSSPAGSSTGGVATLQWGSGQEGSSADDSREPEDDSTAAGEAAGGTETEHEDHEVEAQEPADSQESEADDEQAAGGVVAVSPDD